jgi:hypothetical protein
MYMLYLRRGCSSQGLALVLEVGDDALLVAHLQDEQQIGRLATATAAQGCSNGTIAARRTTYPHVFKVACTGNCELSLGGVWAHVDAIAFDVLLKGSVLQR